jgi:hypothetical protein
LERELELEDMKQKLELANLDEDFGARAF